MTWTNIDIIWWIFVNPKVQLVIQFQSTNSVITTIFHDYELSIFPTKTLSVWATLSNHRKNPSPLGHGARPADNVRDEVVTDV